MGKEKDYNEINPVGDEITEVTITEKSGIHGKSQTAENAESEKTVGKKQKDNYEKVKTSFTEYEKLNISDANLGFDLKSGMVGNAIADVISNCELPSDKAEILLRAALEFYQADWTGVLIGNPENEEWKPYWWFCKNGGMMADCRITDLDFEQIYPLWKVNWRQKKSLIITDIAKLKARYRSEWEIYQDLGIHNLMAVPFNREMSGYIVLKNPAEFPDNPKFLKLCMELLLPSVSEHMIMRSFANMNSHAKDPDLFGALESNEVVICLFGTPSIRFKNRTYSQEDLPRKYIWDDLRYLAANRGNWRSIRQMAFAIDPGVLWKNIQNPIYFLNKLCEDETGLPLIENRRGAGYRLNPELKITTDFELMDSRILACKKITNPYEQIEALKSIANIYQGPIGSDSSSAAWILNMAGDYQKKYRDVMKVLLPLIYKYEDIETLKTYVAEAMKTDHTDAIFNGWYYVFLIRQGLKVVANNVNELVWENNSKEEFKEYQEIIRIVK